MKINSPNKSYTGKDRYGDTVLDFNDGVADFEGTLPSGVRQYLEGAGYGLGKAPEPVETPAPVDPRGLENERVGTELRDAAVNPRPEDFLAPVNAGKEGDEGNPHGPNVVSPELHASQGARPVKGGPVEGAATQEAAETAGARPAGNASEEVWAKYATAQGKDVEGLSRNQIRDLFN